MPDHVHVMLSVLPKYSVVGGGGIHQSESVTHLARVYAESRGNFVGQHFWARGYFVSTVRQDEEVIRNYIKHRGEEVAAVGGYMG